MQQQQQQPPPATTTTTAAPLQDTDHFTQALKEWVEVDNRVTYYNQQLKECRQQRNHLTPSICNYMERAEMKNLNIQISDGTLHYANEQVTPSFTQQFVLTGLTEYFAARGLVDGSVAAKECVEFLKSRRVPETKTVLKRKYTSNAAAATQ
jgi:hypothetical protein